MILVVMGVAGCGKTLIGRLLAQRLSLPFYDADAWHSSENIAKMAVGIPLTDGDRWPWLDSLAREMVAWEAEGGAVLACSALREAYRDRLRATGAPVRLVFLRTDPRVLQERLSTRCGHYMKAEMLASQLETLEPPMDAVIVDAAAPPEAIAEAVVKVLQGNAGSGEEGIGR